MKLSTLRRIASTANTTEVATKVIFRKTDVYKLFISIITIGTYKIRDRAASWA